ncbi:MAG: MerR family transcriptional regulator [Firmicutes bacterium]|nr:MerR family transcriptional regulator [Bacillota bacterium]
MTEKKYSVNEICKMCNITRKQLLYYESRGLLTEVSRNKDNNYRSYSWQNINEILAANEFKKMGVPIQKIGSIFSNSNLLEIQEFTKNQMLRAKEDFFMSFARYEAYSEKYTRLCEGIALIKQHIAKEHWQSGDNYDIFQYPDRNVIAISFDSPFLDSNKKYVEMLCHLYSIAQDYDAIISGPLVNLYHGHFDSNACTKHSGNFKTEVCLPVKEIKKPCPYYKEIKGFKGISTYHIGKFGDKLVQTYLDMLHFAKARGYKLKDLSIEDWLVNPLTVKDESLWVTQISIPFVDDD